jgi:hypothetical protein
MTAPLDRRRRNVRSVVEEVQPNTVIAVKRTEAAAHGLSTLGSAILKR